MLLRWHESGETENSLLVSCDHRLVLRKSTGFGWDQVNFLHSSSYALDLC